MQFGSEASVAIGDKDPNSKGESESIGRMRVSERPQDMESITKIRGGDRSDKRKQSLYFPREMLEEIWAEARRLDRSMSWIVQRAWKLAKPEIGKYPSVNEPDEGDPND
jgi:uncharacterized small protein (TIGR04563 family)